MTEELLSPVVGHHFISLSSAVVDSASDAYVLCTLEFVDRYLKNYSI